MQFFLARSLRRRAVYALAAMLALAPILIACNETQDDPEPSNVSYSPDKETFEKARNDYNGSPVTMTADGSRVIGHGDNATTFDLAKRIARSDAAEIAARRIVLPSLRTRDREAADYFENQALSNVQADIFYLFDMNMEPTYALTRAGSASIYDLFWRLDLTNANVEDLVQRLAEWYSQTFRGPGPTDITFSVVLSTLQGWEMERKQTMVLEKMDAVMRQLSYRGELGLVDKNAQYRPHQVENLRQMALGNLPDGSQVEVQFALRVPYNEKLKELRLVDLRGRRMDPIAVQNHPRPVGGRYTYEFAIGPYMIRKGQDAVTIEVADVRGRIFNIEYALYDEAGEPQFGYTDANIGLFFIKQFTGDINLYLEEMNKQLVFPDPNGGPAQRVRIETFDRVFFGGISGAGAGAGTVVEYRISVYRSNTKKVSVTFEQPPNWEDRVDDVAWDVVWEEFDPNNKYGELNDIKIPSPIAEDGDEDRGLRMFVRVDYNAGNDYDILLFDWRGRDPHQRMTEATQVLYSTASG